MMASAAPAPAVTAAMTYCAPLAGIESASAIETAGAFAYAIGDDAAFFYVLATGESAAGAGDAWRIVGKHQLFDAVTTGGATEHIAKKVKPDLELMTPLPLPTTAAAAGVGARIACLGSGSKVGTRDRVFLVDMPAPVLDAAAGAPAPRAITEVSAHRIYQVLRTSPAALGSAKLNLEAATLTAGDVLRGGGATSGMPNNLFIFQRGNISGVNSFIHAPADAFAAALDAAAPASAAAGGGAGAAAGAGAGAGAAPAPLPRLAVGLLSLPKLEGFNAGASGAATVMLPLPGGAEVEAVLISASYEATTNEIDDGETLGSLIGVVPAAALAAVVAPGGAGAVIVSESGDAAAAPTAAVGAGGTVNVPCALVRSADGSIYRGKIEGVAPLSARVTADGSTVEIDVVAVTDADGGPSEVLRVTLTVPIATLRTA